MRKSTIWHPFTQHALVGDMPEAASAQGAWLKTAGGSRIFDAISSWWVVTHGHCHPRIIGAIREQAGKLDQVIFANFTHAPAKQLARMLLARANGRRAVNPPPRDERLAAGRSPAVADGAHPVALPPEEAATGTLAHVFYSDSGSTAVEVALKMALGFWHNNGTPRTRIAALQHGYHGDTIGTMAAGARGIFNAAYEPLLFEVERLPFPSAGREQATFDALDAACKRAPLAALVVEPLVLGAGGMLMYGPSTLCEMKRICEHYGTLFIADEVMTGFGRTGTFLACHQAGIRPDILCIAKGITGGSLPLAATLCTAPIFDAHYSNDRTKTFFHSSSYTANPIACAAAVANMEIWESEPVMERIAALERMQAERLLSFEDDPRFENSRRMGTIAAIDVKVNDSGYLAGIGPGLSAAALARGVLLRPLGNTIYVMPPYCTEHAELDIVYESIRESVRDALAPRA